MNVSELYGKMYPNGLNIAQVNNAVNYIPEGTNLP